MGGPGSGPRGKVDHLAGSYQPPSDLIESWKKDPHAMFEFIEDATLAAVAVLGNAIKTGAADKADIKLFKELAHPILENKEKLGSRKPSGPASQEEAQEVQRAADEGAGAALGGVGEGPVGVADGD